jgi:hypothetical protein
MTQSPYGGTASQSMQSTAGTSTGSGVNTGHSGSTAQGSGNDFGATTISGAPKQGAQHGTDQRGGQPGGAHLAGSAGQTSGQTATQARPAAPAAAPAGRAARNRGPRRARLQLRHISPLTVLKFSCVLAIALFFVWLIVVGVLYGVLDAAGVIQNVNDTVVQLNGSGSKPPITAGIVFGGAAIVGVVSIVLFVALTTIGSVIYNLCADLVGGIEITLSER